MRDTSIEAWEQIKGTAFLETKQGQVYEYLRQNPCSTQMEITYLMRAQSPRHHSVSSVSPRFAELERDGLIKATHKKICSITGRKVLAWETDWEGKKISIKPQSKAQQLKQLKDIIERISKATSLEEVRLIIDSTNTSTLK